MSCPPSPPDGRHYPLFVYGTLRRTQENFTLLRGYVMEAQPAAITGYALYHVNGCPIIVPGDHTVFGELLRFKPAVYTRVLAQLDDLERSAGRPAAGELHRALSVVQTGAEDTMAWLYRADGMPPGADAILIPHGDWVKHQLGRITNTRLNRYIDNEIQKGMR